MIYSIAQLWRGRKFAGTLICSVDVLAAIRSIARTEGAYFPEMASPAMLTVSAIIVTLKMKATSAWTATVLRIAREVTSTSETAVDVPTVKAK